MPMRFPYLKAARVKLQERKNACMRAKYTMAPQELQAFVRFFETNPVTRTIALELNILFSTTIGNLEKWVDGDQQRLNLPEDEHAKAALYLKLVKELASPDPQIPSYCELFVSGSDSFQDQANDWMNQVLLPLYGYVEERIDDGDLILYLLCRYQREVGWFRREELWSLFQENQSKAEEVLDRDFRHWLLHQGIDFPFSTPRMPSGRPDVIVWEGEEPLPVEVKVYDGASRDAAHISQGLWQAFRYATDLAKPFAYLLVFSASNDVLNFEGNSSGSVPPRIQVGDKNVFAVCVQIAPTEATASKEKPQRTVTVKRPGSQGDES